MASEKSILIIGAGIAGLSAGYYGLINGFKVLILEKGDKAGGQCTSWQQGDYTVNGCIHWLVGSGPGNEMYDIWEELGALQGIQMVNHDRFAHYEHIDGQDVILYCDPERLREHWLALAPEEESFIKSFTRSIQVLKDSHLETPHEKQTLFNNLRFNIERGLKGFYSYREIMKWSRYSCGDIARKLENPYLKAAFLHMGKDMPVLAIVFTLAWMSNHQAGYPIGGSGLVTANILEKYQAAGGSISYHAPVKEILVDDHCARGVVLEDGQVYHGDYVISAADGHSTIYEMLHGKFKDEKIDHFYQHFPLFEPILYASFGINHPFSKIEGAAIGRSFLLEIPLSVGNRIHDRLTVQIYNFDPTLAPKGKTLVTAIIETNYDYWKTLYQDEKKYLKEKQRILMKLMERLTDRFPEIYGKVEMMDLATPITYERYTGVYRGSYEGWRLTTETFREKMKKSLPGLENFYMAGQWVEPGGGLPPAAMSGREVIRMICKKEDKKFLSSLPAQVAVYVYQHSKNE